MTHVKEVRSEFLHEPLYMHRGKVYKLQEYIEKNIYSNDCGDKTTLL